MHKGFAQLETSMGKVGLSGNWVGWIPSQTDHMVVSKGAVSGTSFRIDQGLTAVFPAISIVQPASALVVQLLQRLAALNSGERQANLLHVLADEISAGTSRVSGARAGVVAKLIEAMSADPASAMTLADWARTIGTSERTLARHLRRETGKSFIDWRTELRIAKARQLLRFCDSVTDAASAVGYDSPNAFARCFHKLTGQLPSAFRLSGDVSS